MKLLGACLIFLYLLILAGCGPFELSIELASTPGERTPSATASASPAADAGPTVAALQTENARLVSRVATLAAPTPLQSATVTSQPPATQPAPTPTTPAPPTSIPPTPVPPTPVRPTPTPAPAGPPVRITFQPGSASVTVSPNLVASQSQAYVLKISAGQHIILTADHELQAQVLGPDNRPLGGGPSGPRQWDFAVTQTGDQTIILSGIGRVTVTIYVPPR